MSSMGTSERMRLLNELVDEVIRDSYDVDKVKNLMARLGIVYKDDPIQLLNNVLQGIHQPGVKNEPSI